MMRLWACQESISEFLNNSIVQETNNQLFIKAFWTTLNWWIEDVFSVQQRKNKHYVKTFTQEIGCGGRASSISRQKGVTVYRDVYHVFMLLNAIGSVLEAFILTATEKVGESVFHAMDG